eukprot:772181_1
MCTVVMFRQSKILPSSIEGIDQKSKDLVFGFIKVCAFNAPLEALVPDSILHIVLVYFCTCCSRDQRNSMFRQSKILPSSIEGIDQKSKDLSKFAARNWNKGGINDTILSSRNG